MALLNKNGYLSGEEDVLSCSSAAAPIVRFLLRFRTEANDKGLIRRKHPSSQILTDNEKLLHPLDSPPFKLLHADIENSEGVM